jgi:uncharacterized membrane protein YebE (DUF533 family)
MSASRRFTAAALLAAGLAIGTAVTAAGCGGSSPAAAPATTSAAPPAAPAPSPSPSKSPKISAAVLQNIINCMKSHGVSFSTERPTGKDVRHAFTSLTVARQQSVFSACGQVLPANARQLVQQRMAQETAGATASP